MGITGNAGYAEGVAEDYICGLSAHAGKLEKLLHGIGDFTAKLLYYLFAGAFDIDCLIMVKAGAVYIRFDFFEVCLAQS